MSKSIHREELIVIYRQEILKDIRLFTSQPVAKFYDSLFLNLDLSFVPEFPKTGRKGFSNHAMICSFIVMKCEGFSMITDLVDYLNNNLLIAHYWGYKNHVLVDCISGLPIYELTTTANVHESTVALDILADTHTFLPITECTFLADKGYDVKNIYNQVQELYQGECIIPLNKRSTKNPKLLPQGNPIVSLKL